MPRAAQPSPMSPSKGASPRLNLGLLRFAFCLLPFTFSLVSCSPTYVLRAGYEEAKILWRREPIERLLQQSDLDAATRSKLELVLAARSFARDTLHLRVNGSYATYARVDADQVVHVVTAAYRLKLQSYMWWFPIVGRVPYKGYFSKASADAEAKCLEEGGYDTSVRPSVAFSTLGWFADPLLSNLLRYDRATLANVVIHELLHNTTYIGGHADFDESFANFVGHRGALVFLESRGDAAAARDAAAAWDDALQFSDFLGRFTTHLRDAYASGVTLDERQRLFTAGQEEFRTLALQTAMFRDFGTQSLNNAVILEYLMYADQLRLFEDLLHEHSGDLAETIQVIVNAVQKHGGDPFAAVREEQATSGVSPAALRRETLHKTPDTRSSLCQG
ncbi:MAG TPA: aminopeptidase [Candidatus Acidoferrales bacterium]|nr:aminopeptidase [Candidatus Acidoferrales bacterium]